MTDLARLLRAFEGSDALGNGDFSVCIEAASSIETLQFAIYDMAKNIWRGDWNRLEQETRDVVERVMKERGERE
ncbi:MAG: hypothetical protein ACK5VI_02840 [Opitutia bacterium]|jgi:hypothetical protein